MQIPPPLALAQGIQQATQRGNAPLCKLLYGTALIGDPLLKGYLLYKLPVWVASKAFYLTGVDLDLYTSLIALCKAPTARSAYVSMKGIHTKDYYVEPRPNYHFEDCAVMQIAEHQKLSADLTVVVFGIESCESATEVPWWVWLHLSSVRSAACEMTAKKTGVDINEIYDMMSHYVLDHTEGPYLNREERKIWSKYDLSMRNPKWEEKELATILRAHVEKIVS